MKLSEKRKDMLAVQPQYIIDRKYKTFKNIEVIYREEIQKREEMLHPTKKAS